MLYLRDRGHTHQLIVHKLHQRTRYSFLVRMLFDNVEVVYRLNSYLFCSVVNINFVTF